MLFVNYTSINLKEKKGKKKTCVLIPTQISKGPLKNLNLDPQPWAMKHPSLPEGCQNCDLHACLEVKSLFTSWCQWRIYRIWNSHSQPVQTNWPLLLPTKVVQRRPSGKSELLPLFSSDKSLPSPCGVHAAYMGAVTRRPSPFLHWWGQDQPTVLNPT